MSTIAEIRDYTNAAAPGYDQAANESGYTTNQHVAAAAVQWIREDADNLTYLDLGAGTGRTVQAVAAVLPFSRIVAVDFSEPMLEQLPGNMPEGLTVNRYAFPIGTYLEWAIEQGKRFDLTTCVSVLDCYQDLERIFAGVGQVLEQSGTFVCTYSPFIAGHPLQGQRQQVFTQSRTGKSIECYTRSMDEVGVALKAAGLAVVKQELFSPLPGDASKIGALAVAKKRGSLPRFTGTASIGEHSS